MTKPIVILGIFNADTAYRADRQPKMGETILGTSFVLGPGGKGSNQSVAAAMAGGRVHFITRLGADAFAEIAQATRAKAGVVPEVKVDHDSYTGAAYIFIENATGNNAIIVAPGAAGRVSVQDVEEKADLIRSAAIFVTQLEQPIPAAQRALEIARAAGVTTILNPAPAASWISRTVTRKSFGLPSNAGLSDSDCWVFAMQIGSLSNPAFFSCSRSRLARAV